MLAPVDPNAPDRVDDVERQLLGACMWSDQHDTSGFDEAAAVVSPDDFAVYAHRLVFGELLALRANGSPANAVTLFSRLRANSTLNELGPDPKVWIGDTVTLQTNDLNAGHYAALVKEASRRRWLRCTVAEMGAIVARAVGPTDDVRAECEQLLFTAGGADGGTGPRSAAELVPEALERIDRIAGGQEPPGVATGYADLDAILGGLSPGQVVIIAARPSVGKTALSLGIATNATRVGVPTLFASLEMSRGEIMERILAMRSGVWLSAIKKARLNPGQADRVESAGRQFAKEPFHLEETSPMSAARLASIVRRGVRRDGLKLAVVDYLGLMEPEDLKAPKVHQIGTLSRRLKQLARACGIPIIVLAQLNRESESRTDGKPKLSDLRDSGEVEQDADIAILLSRQKDQSDESEMWLIDADVAKNRNGAIGLVTLAYRRPIVRFENAAVDC